ncbi:MAG: class I tRNA ligase family protein [Candidatus Omnitrophota bacterium]
MDKFYITTAIDYPSGPPHIGHFYEKVCADTLARWYRGRGHDVFFSTGADEHGQKMEKYAFLAKESASEFSRRMSDKFVSLWGRVGISYNRFIRTTDAGHCRLVQEIIERLYRQGDIYKGEYEGLYCVDCEGYYLPRDLNNGRCHIHNKPAEKIKEQSYFLNFTGPRTGER